MSESKANGFTVAVVVAAALFAIFVWPSLYRYDHINVDGEVHPVRIQRVSGKAEILYQNGWQKTYQESSKPEASLLPADELSKLEGKMKFEDDRLECNFYNGSSYRVDEIVVHLKITDINQTVIVDRDYEILAFVSPLNSDTLIKHINVSRQENQKVSWYIKQATGIKQ